MTPERQYPLLQPIQCDCDKCASMCANSTCMPTPEEARALIRAGYGPRLSTYGFFPAPALLRVVGPSPKSSEGARDVLHTRAECTFFDGHHCELHDLGLKPLEGRLAHHDRPWLPIRLHVIGHWQGKQFESVVAMLERIVS